MMLGSIISSLRADELRIVMDPDSSFANPVTGPPHNYSASIGHLLETLGTMKVIRIFDIHEACNPIPKIYSDAIAVWKRELANTNNPAFQR